MDTEVTFIRCCCSCDHNCNSLSCVNQKVKYDVCVCVGPMCARESECVCAEEKRHEEKREQQKIAPNLSKVNEFRCYIYIIY